MFALVREVSDDGQWIQFNIPTSWNATITLLLVHLHKHNENKTTESSHFFGSVPTRDISSSNGEKNWCNKM
jgi:hypothetical protein